MNFQMFKLDLEKVEEPKTNCQHLWDHTKSMRIPKENHLCFIDSLKPLCGAQQIVENSERDGNTRPPDLPLGKHVCRSRNNS